MIAFPLGQKTRRASFTWNFFTEARTPNKTSKGSKTLRVFESANIKTDINLLKRVTKTQTENELEIRVNEVPKTAHSLAKIVCIRKMGRDTRVS